MSYKERTNFKKAKIGSDYFEDSFSPISYDEGNGELKPLFILDRNTETQEVFLTTEVRDENGRFLAKLWRNNFVPQGDDSLDGEREFETKRIPNSFTLTRREDGKVIFYAKAEIPNSWTINGIFHVLLGDSNTKIEITDLKTTISNRYTNITLSNNEIYGGGIKISEHGFSI